MKFGPIEIRFNRNGAEATEAVRPVRRRGPRFHGRAFGSTSSSNLYQGFKGTSASINEDLINGLRTLRYRSRQLCQDNDYACKFLNLVSANIVGNQGIRLQSLATGRAGEPDEDARTGIEEAWSRWGKRGVCDVTGRLSWLDVQRLVAETLGRDGEVLVVHHEGYDNEFGYALQVLECDRLNETLNVRLDNGNRIIMGVEHDQFGKPVAYHLMTNHPGDGAWQHRNYWYDRYEASRILHIFVVKRPEQCRGYPWLTSAMLRLDMLHGYEEAEWTAARVAACKMGVVKTPSGDEFTGDAVDTDGALIDDLEPGSWRQLPEGQDFDMFDPTHPNTAYSDFIKGVLRGAAAGMNVSYNGLANDLEGVNFSSIRAGVLDERDQWRVLQSFVSEALCDRVFRVWLGHALTSGSVVLPPAVDHVTDAKWVARGWPWVDPVRDIDAAARGIELGISTRTDAAAAQGRDFNDIVKRLQEEEKILVEAGLKPDNTMAPSPEDESPDEEPDEDDAEDDPQDES